MKKISAFIKPGAVQILENYFGEIGHPVIKTYIKDQDQIATRSVFWRDDEYVVDIIKNVKIEVVLEENAVDDALRNISRFLHEEDGNNCEYEYALRLKSGIIKKDIITEDGRWVSLTPKQEHVFSEGTPLTRQSEVLKIVDVCP
ncbi:nitrogen regulatory protein P-II-like protein [Candidatus Kuenenia stuttgartiensis]|jgi:nitrogen regulatory protein PII|uniref:Nitrogen regulatory protein P-II-like protein n=1 Tax=Kuenenia stuttgartiensis TaxID=174633 RepID=A0A2C9CKK6_KUEST|nr:MULTISPECIES: hypothetical protein [Kuenenia]MBE7549170.1 hypothetical protein [Planctomycetia bacterium]MBW7943174.1 hypothetical protein [Candidatus Kuenenia stuttgartiensis]MBZ0190536.1 hypothetical protein [Candidatus Kuenenia stuttgartiensis]MCF6152176.1 hypothetical protein [Candidatus Kuenenia stuttgartiensis]MCL4727874.1 hypothetical protein [Candidatus Kuenenia stuttgartiensis]